MTRKHNYLTILKVLIPAGILLIALLTYLNIKPSKKEVIEIVIKNPDLELSIERPRAVTRTNVKDKVHADPQGNLGNILNDIRTFRDLEGEETWNNFSIFLQYYYGLNGKPAFGDALVNQMVGTEIEWAVKIVAFSFPDDSELGFALVEPTFDFCRKFTCEADWKPNVIVKAKKDSSFFKHAREGKYMSLRGDIKLFEVSQNMAESSFDRMHIHWTHIRFMQEKSND